MASVTSTTAESITSTLPPWPPPATFEGYPPEVGAVLMEAQAAEVAKLRETAMSGPTKGVDPWNGWTLLTIVGLLVVVLVWWNPSVVAKILRTTT
jgi:hypothetical protein